MQTVYKRTVKLTCRKKTGQEQIARLHALQFWILYPQTGYMKCYCFNYYNII